MAIDGVMLNCIKNDLEQTLIGARIKKIYQPEDKLLDFNLRQPGEDYKLLISTHPQKARVHISNLNFDNPRHPPTFCMLLRKYLSGGIIKKISQPNFERILNINIENNFKTYTLILEIMGRYSNVILIDEEENVLDSLKRITKKISSERELYPGIQYQLPPAQDKLNPLSVNKDDFFAKIPADFSKYCFRAILYNFRGIGPYFAKEIVYRAGVNYEQHYIDLSKKQRDNIWLSFQKIFKLTKNNFFNPTMGIKDKKVEYISAFPLKHLKENMSKIIDFSNSGQLFEYYYNHFIKNRMFKKQQKRLDDIISNYLQKNRKKQKEIRDRLKASLKADKYKQKGELLKANIYKMEKGMKEIKVANFYDQNKEISIDLDPKLSPSENIQKYFKKYNKAHKSKKHLKRELGKFRHEERYLEQVLLNIEQSSSEEELMLIEKELKDEKYIKKEKQKNNKKKSKRLPPRKYKSSQGYDILVGRNNRQNDQLTKKMANNHDLWLHTKKIAGSHVIIRNDTAKEIPVQTIKEAARLAAYYSKGKMSSNVPIDFTEVKNVNKPAGAKPGLVYYDNYQTIYVDPANLEEK